MSFYAHRVNSFKLLAHVNCLMGVVHTTRRTTMLIAMYFGEYPIYLSMLLLCIYTDIYRHPTRALSDPPIGTLFIKDRGCLGTTGS
jgi:hypothetical protein